MFQLKGKITKIRRDDEKYSSAQIIFATIELEDGGTFDVEWANIHGDETFGSYARLNGMDFDDAWKNAEEGMTVLCNIGIQGFNIVR